MYKTDGMYALFYKQAMCKREYKNSELVFISKAKGNKVHHWSWRQRSLCCSMNRGEKHIHGIP